MITSFAPAPGAAPRSRMLAAQTSMEFRLLLRNGEQVGLTLVIPLLLLFFFNLPLLYSLDSPRRIDFVVPSIIALAVMSAAFTGLANGTGTTSRLWYFGVSASRGSTEIPRPDATMLRIVSSELLRVTGASPRLSSGQLSSTWSRKQ